MEARRRKKSAKGVKSTPSSSSSSCAIANLPDPVLLEILCRLPIKTLTASKSVCKSWLGLIRDPQFPHLHQSRAPTEVFFQPSLPEKDEAMRIHLGNFHFPDNLLPCHFEFPYMYYIHKDQGIREKIFFANSCNGLLCYYGSFERCRFALVWNPCTSQYILFPPPFSICYGYGLGFSTKSNKFKLLRLPSTRDDGSSPDDMVVADVCTIEKSCSWKRVGPCSSNAWFRDYSNRVRDVHTVFLKGTLHWVGEDSCSSYIVVHTFDFEDDRFGSVPLPRCLSTTHEKLHPSRGDNLGVLEGCLFITEHHRDKSVIVWLMKEYGVQDSWTKLFSLGSAISVDTGLEMKFNHCLPITYMGNGEILMKRTFRRASTIIVYNPVLKSARVMGSCPASLRVIVYSPSLVMLNDSMPNIYGQEGGCYVYTLPKWDGLIRGKLSKALDWWIPVKKLVKKHGSGSYSSSQQTGSTEHERDQSEWSADSVERVSSPVKKSTLEHGSKAPFPDGELSVAEVEEEGEGHISGKGLIQISTTSAADLACQQGPKTPATTSEIHVSATREDPLERITTMIGEVVEERRKDREQRQELEERLRNELEPLKEEAEHLKLQNQQFEEGLKQQTLQFEERLLDEHAKVEHLKQQNQQLEERLQDEHAKVKQLEDQIEKLSNKEERNQKIMQMMDEMKVRLMSLH